MTTEIANVIPGLMMTSLEEMIVDDALLKELAGQVDTGVDHQSTLPIMSIFHNTPHNDCIHEEGSFVIGLTKHTEGEKKDRVKDQGDRVVAFTVLAQRKKYNYFNDKDKANACESNFFVDFKEEKRGYKHKHVCDKKGTCPFIKMEKDGCKCQILLVGKAHLENGTTVNARYYAGGSAYMPTADLMQSGYRIVTANGTKDLQCYMVPVVLGHGPLIVKGVVKYYEPTYTIQGTHPADQWKGLLEEAKNAVDFFKMSDEARAKKEGVVKSDAGTVGAGPETTVPPQYATQTPVQTVQTSVEAQTAEVALTPVEMAQAALAAATAEAALQVKLAEDAAAGAATTVNPVTDAAESTKDRLNALMKKV